MALCSRRRSFLQQNRGYSFRPQAANWMPLTAREEGYSPPSPSAGVLLSDAGPFRHTLCQTRPSSCRFAPRRGFACLGMWQLL
jgi:hypothetical protein